MCAGHLARPWWCYVLRVVLGLLLHSLQLQALGAQDISFFSPTVLSQGSADVSVMVSGDFDNNGAVDVILGSSRPPYISWLHDAGHDQAVTQATTIDDSLTYTAVNSLFPAFLNNDNSLDLIFCAVNSVGWLDLHGHPPGTQQAVNVTRHILLNQSCAQVYANNVAGDSALDVVAALNVHETDTDLVYWTNLGELFPSTPVHIARITGSTSALNVVDLDGDNVPDILVCANSLWLFKGLGGGEFAAPRVVVAESELPQSLTFGDFRGVGVKDLVVNTGTGHFIYLQNDGLANFVNITVNFPESNLEVGPMVPLVAADVNGDDRLDLLAGVTEGSTIFANIAPPGEVLFDRGVLLDSVDGSSGLQLLAVDTQGAGVLDVIASPGNVVYLNRNERARPLFLQTQLLTTTTSGSTSVSVADMGRGVEDALYLDFVGLHIVYNDGRGNFSHSELLDAGMFSAMRTCELTNSGRLDVLYGKDGTLMWARNEGTIHNPSSSSPSSVNFTLSSLYDLGPDIGIFTVSCGDVNKDGRVDVVVGAASHTTGEVKVTVLLSQGELAQPQFVSAFVGQTSAAHPVFYVSLADFNGDGQLDILYSRVGGIGLFLGDHFNATGVTYTHQLVPNLGFPGGLNDIAVADINMDGWMDVIIIGVSSSFRVATNLGLPGPVTFALSTYPSGVLTPTAVVIGDITGNGWPDVCVQGLEVVCHLRGPKPESGFGRMHRLPVKLKSGGSNMLLRDVNGDGLLDLINNDDGVFKIHVTLNAGRFIRVDVDALITLLNNPNAHHTRDVTNASAVYSPQPLQPVLNPAAQQPVPGGIFLHARHETYTLYNEWVLSVTPFTQRGTSIVVVLPLQGLTLQCCTPSVCLTLPSNTTLMVVGGPLTLMGCPVGEGPSGGLQLAGARIHLQYSRLCSSVGNRSSFCPAHAPVRRSGAGSPFFPGPPRERWWSRALQHWTDTPPSPFLRLSGLSTVTLLASGSELIAMGYAGQLCGVVEHCRRAKEEDFVVLLWSGLTASLQGWVFRNNIGTAVSASGVNLYLTASLFENNTAHTAGALSVSFGSQLFMSDVQFRYNRATGGAGAINIVNSVGPISLKNVLAEHNAAVINGGFLRVGTNVVANAQNLTCRHNTASASGGAIVVLDSSTLTLQRSVFTDNQAGAGGALGMLRGSAHVSICEFTRNTANGLGGAVYAAFSQVLFTESVVQNNRAEYGGGIYTDGAISVGSLLYMFTTRVLGNVAQSGGGLLSNGCQTSFENCILANNHAIGSSPGTGHGGGALLFASEFSSTFTNVSFTNCTAKRQGGALWTSTAGAAVVLVGGSAVSCHAGTGGGGGVFSQMIPANWSSPLFAHNTAPYGPNQATTARTLRLLQDTVSSQSQQSGEPFLGLLELELVDAFGQRILTDSLSSATLGGHFGSGSSVLQVASTEAVRGYFNLTGALAFLAPSFDATFQLQWRIIGNQDTAASLPPDLAVHIGLCPSGLVPNQKRCVLCPAGTFSDVAGASACGACMPGTFSSHSGATSCTQCLKPSFASTNRSTVCSQCLAGLYWVASDRPCTACAGNQLPLNGACVCPPDTIRIGVTLCEKCSAVEGALCPNNVTNLSPQQVEARNGYWRVPTSAAVEFLPCPFAASCGHHGCTAGAEGPCCMICQSGSYRDFTGKCQGCPDQVAASVASVTVVLFLLVLFIVVLYMHYMSVEWEEMPSSDDQHGADNDANKEDDMNRARQHSPHAKRPSVMVPRRSHAYRLTALFKIVLGHVQIVVLVLSAASHRHSGFPQSARSFAVYLGVGLLRVAHIVPLACISSQPYVLGVVCTLLLPLILLLIVGLAALLLWLLHRRGWGRLLSPADVRRRAVKAASVLLVLVYPFTTAELLETFFHRRCGTYLNTVGLDAGLETTDRAYTGVQVASALGLLVYTCGIPCLFAGVLYKNRHNLWNPFSSVALKYSFLYQDLARTRWWFSPVAMLEKVCYALIVVFLSGAVFQQYTLEVLLTVTSAVSLAVLHPYTGWYQTLLLSSRLTIFLTIFGAMVLWSQEICGTALAASGGSDDGSGVANELCTSGAPVNAAALSAVLICLNCLVVMSPVAYLITWCRKDGHMSWHMCPSRRKELALRDLQQSLL